MENIPGRNTLSPSPAPFIFWPSQYLQQGTIMSARILVAYVSPKGSTAGIAQAIGKELLSAGYGVDVVEMKTVSSLEGYNAVVIGAPLYMGKVVGDVKKFSGSTSMPWKRCRSPRLPSACPRWEPTPRSRKRR